MRRLHGRWMVAAIRPRRHGPDGLGAAEGPHRRGRARRGDGPARGGRGDGRARPLAREARRRPLLSTTGRASGSSRSSRSSSSATRAAGSATCPRRSGTRWPRCAGCRSRRRPRLLAYGGERDMARKAVERLADGRTYDRRPVPAYALNFYSPIVEAQLKSHRKTATIRLGDKSRKYQKGMIVSVLVRRALQPAPARLRRGDRQGRGEDDRRALAERDRARQPGDPPRGRALPLPRASSTTAT